MAASIRHPVHVVEAAKAGAHIVTLPAIPIARLDNFRLVEHKRQDKCVASHPPQE